MPCPLCLLGLKEPHTREDWDSLRDPEVRARLDEIHQRRLDRIRAEEAAADLPPGSLIMRMIG